MEKINFKDGDILYASQLNQLQTNTEDAIAQNTQNYTLYEHNLKFRILIGDNDSYAYATVFTKDSMRFADNGNTDSSWTSFVQDNNGIQCMCTGYFIVNEKYYTITDCSIAYSSSNVIINMTGFNQDDGQTAEVQDIIDAYGGSALLYNDHVHPIINI